MFLEAVHGSVSFQVHEWHECNSILATKLPGVSLHTQQDSK
jgi:hypothetical protein